MMYEVNGVMVVVTKGEYRFMLWFDSKKTVEYERYVCTEVTVSVTFEVFVGTTKVLAYSGTDWKILDELSKPIVFVTVGTTVICVNGVLVRTSWTLMF